MSGVVSNGPGGIVLPGAYVQTLSPQQSVAPEDNTSRIAIVGGGNWGPLNTAVATSDAASIYDAWGNDTVSAYSMVLELLMALTEDGNAISVRVDDGTSAAATIAVLDGGGSGASHTVFTLTANYHGSLPNGNPGIDVSAASVLVQQVGNTQVFNVTINFPGQPPEIFNGIIGYGNAGTPTTYNAATFQANVAAAINGTGPNQIGSQRWTCSTSGDTSSIAPATGTLFAATGGADGTSGLTLTDLIGTDTTPGVGMYALRGTGFSLMGIAGCTNLAEAAAMSALVASEGAALAFITVPKGTSDASAITSRLSSGATQSNVVIVKDFIYINDPVQGTQRYVSPIGKAMGIVGLCPPEASPINQPYNITGAGAAYVIGTEQSAVGPRSTAELAALLTNGFISITNQIPLGNGSFGIFDDVTAAGSPTANNGAGQYIPTIRMDAFLAQAFLQLGGPFVGKTQSTAANDPLRATVRATFNNFLSQLAPNGGPQRIDNWDVTCDLTNNTPQTISQGYCYVSVRVRFLGIVRIFFVTLQGGTNVQITAETAQPT